jgi:hypothetical protein
MRIARLLLLLTMLLSCGRLHALPTGTSIENQATASFQNDASSSPELLTSNRVSVVVEQRYGLLLQAENQQSVAQSGQTIVLAHQLMNDSTASDSVSVTLSNLAGDDFDFAAISLWLDANDNQQIDGGDTPLGQSALLNMAAGEQLLLLVEASVPTGINPGVAALLQLMASASGEPVTSVDRVTVTTGQQSLTITAPGSSQLTAGQSFVIDLEMLASATDDLQGLPVLVDGQSQSRVLIETRLPSGVFLVEPVIAPENYVTLYKIAGTAAGTYTESVPTDLRQVSAIAIAKSEVLANETAQYSLTMAAEGESRPINLQTTIQTQSEKLTSNAILLTLVADPDTGSLLTVNDVNPGVQQVFLRTNGPMALRFTCFICDSDPDLVEDVSSEISSAVTGDIEPVDLRETGSRDGVFYSDSLALLPAEQVPPETGDGVMSVGSNDTLTLTVKDVDGNTLEQQTILVDPRGFVFNSVTGSLITGAEVTLYSVAADGYETLVEVFFDAAATRPHPNPTYTDADGLYEFPFVAPGQYRLVVTDPTPGFSFASLRSGVEMAEIADVYSNLTGLNDSGATVRGRQITQPQGPSYSGVFTVAADIVFIDIPLDPVYIDDTVAGGAALGLSLTADRKQASFGDAVRYSAKLSNLSGQNIEQAALRVQLPRGFQLLEKGVQWQGEPLVEDVTVEDGQHVFSLAGMSRDETAELNFRLAVNPAAVSGNGLVIARAEARPEALPAVTAPIIYSSFARAKVTLDEGVFRDDGVIIGKVYQDCNLNGQQDSDGKESGLAGIRLYLQNGRYAETDKAGRYSFARLRPGRYLVKADPRSIDGDWQLSQHTVRNQGADKLLLVDLTEGELHRADFPLRSCDSSTNTGSAETATAETTSSEINNRVAELGSERTETAPVADARQLITYPLDGDRIADGQTAVNIRAGLGLAFELQLNGQRVPNSRLGKQEIDKQAAEQRLAYYAIELQPGANSLAVVAKDNWGNIRGQQHITVHRPAALHHLHWQLPEQLQAEGGQQLLRLQLLDERGVRVGGDATVTVTVVNGAELGMEFIDSDVDALQPGIQRLAVDGELSLPILSPQRAGTVTVQASVDDLQADSVLHFMPVMRDWIVAGLVEGELSRQFGQRGEISESQQHRNFSGRIEGNDSHWNDGENRVAARAALFAKGTIKQDYLLTLIADTDKREQDDWAGRLDLERDYPIYGDDSVQGYEGQSEEGLYLRIEKDSNFAQIGDFRPGADNRRTRVGNYNRQLYGFQQHYQGEQWQVETFASQVTSQQLVDNLRLRGTTGPFMLSRREIVTKSEQVEVVTRSRAPDGNIIASETLIPFVDYELDPVLGRIILRAPMSGSDVSGRPRYLRITYNVDEDNGEQRNVFGTDVSYQFNDLTVGGRFLHERNAASDYTLSSINSLYQLDGNTTLVAELADSRNKGLDVEKQGQALNSQLQHRSDQRTVQLSLSGASSNFDNVSAAVTPDSRSADFSWQEHISESSDLWASARWFENSATAVNSYAAEVGTTHRLAESLKLGVSVEETRTDSASGSKLSESSMGIHSRYQPLWMQDLSLQANAYQALSSQRQRQKIAADYRLPNQGSVGLSWERFNGYDVNGDLQSGSDSRQRWALGYRQQVHSSTELFSEYRFEDASNGLENSVASGMRFGYDISDGLRLVAQAERTLDLADNPNEPARYSGSLGLSGFAEDQHKWLARIEMLAADEQRWLQEFRWSSRLGEDWSVLARERLQWRNGFTEVNAEVTAGLAYRPVMDDRWNWLGSYTLERERIGDASLSRQRLRNTVNIQPTQRWTINTSLVMQHTEETGSAAYSSLAWMSRLRLRYDLSENWSVGAMGSYFKDQRLGGGNRGWGVEVQRSLGKQFVIAVGLQHFDYEDRNIDPQSAYSDGLLVRFSGKFDESSLSGLWRLME